VRTAPTRSRISASTCGARHFYISNLPIGRAPQVLAEILERVGAVRTP